MSTTCQHCGRTTANPNVGHWCSQGAKANMKRDGLYPEYAVPLPVASATDFTPREIGLLSLGMAVAGLVAVAARPQPRTMGLLIENREAISELVHKLEAIAKGMRQTSSPGFEDTPAAPAPEAVEARHKAFEEVLVLITGGADMHKVVEYCAAQFDAAKVPT